MSEVKVLDLKVTNLKVTDGIQVRSRVDVLVEDKGAHEVYSAVIVKQTGTDIDVEDIKFIINNGIKLEQEQARKSFPSFQW